MISDIVKVAFVASISPTIAALGSLIVSIRTLFSARKTETRMGDVEKSVDGVKDELVQVTRKAAFAAGIKHEKENPTP